MTVEIFGRKSGGEVPYQPQEERDSLNSVAKAKILDLLCEGEIEGFADPAHPARCVILDGVPIEGPKGDIYIKGVSFSMRTGSANQTPIAGLDSLETEIGVNVVTKCQVPVVKVIENLNTTRVRLNLAFQALMWQKENGDVVGTSVEFKVEIAPKTNIFSTVLQQTVSGKSRDVYNKSVVCTLTGEGPWTIRFTRLTADEDPNSTASSKKYNTLSWASYSEIVDAKLSFPYSAVMQLQIDSSKYAQLPTRGYYLKLKRVLIPSNFYPDWDDEERFVGTWDGTFKEAWTANPAWHVYDLLTNKRYGLGTHLEGLPPNKWAFYAISRYCDELVPDGKGGMERRFECHCYIQDQYGAHELLQQMTSVFRGSPVWSGSQATAIADMPSDPVYQFNATNVENGKFTYADTAKRFRYNAAYVSWYDMSDDSNLGVRRVEYVSDDDDIALNGFNPVSLTAFACTSRGQAHRAGLWAIFSSKRETESVSFKTAMNAAFLVPGDVIEINDSHRSGQKTTGRVIGYNAYTSEIVLDREVTLTPDVEYQLGVTVITTVWSDEFGADIPAHRVEYALVENLGGVTNVIKFSGGFTAPIPNGAIFSIQGGDIRPMLARVASVTNEGNNKLAITASEYHPEKFDHIERGYAFDEVRSTRSLNPVMVTGLKISDQLYIDNNNVKVMVDVHWDRSTEHVRFSAIWRRDSGSWNFVDDIREPGFSIPDALPGEYEVQVTAFNQLDRRSPAAEAKATLLGKMAPPASIDPASISATLEESGIKISFSPIPDLDLDFYETRVGPSWDDPITQLIERTVGPMAFMPAVVGTDFIFHVRARDTSGNWSDTVASKLVTFAPPDQITGFKVTPIGTKLDFSWNIPDRGVRYEIRATDPDTPGGWEVGEQIAQSRTNHVIIEWGRTGSKVFWIKAFDVLGNSSVEPTALNQEVAQLPTRNVVLSKVYGGTSSEALDWSVTGTGYRVEVVGTVLQVERGYGYGERYTPFVLPKQYDVAVAADMKQTAVANDTLTWLAATFSWNSPEARRPWVIKADAADIEIKHFISLKGATDATLVWSGALDGSSTDWTSPPALTYTSGRYGQAAVLAPSNQLSKTLNVTGQWLARATVKLVDVTKSTRLIKLTGAAGSIRVYYSSDRREVVMVGAGMKSAVRLPVVVQDGDMLFVALSQRASSLLLVVKLVGYTSKTGEIDSQIGTLTQLSIGR